MTDTRPSGVGRFLTLDSEAIGLLHALRRGDRTSMHVIGCKDMKSGEVFVFFDPYEMRDPDNRERLSEWEGHQDGNLDDGIRFVMEAEAIVSHNFAGYDALAFEKVFPDDWSCNYLQKRGRDRAWADYFPFRVMDTYVLSTLLNPDRRPPPQAYAMGKGNVGPHSIESHGIRMNRHKPENEDWSKLTDHMITRVTEDVEIGEDYFWWLMRGEWREHIERGANSLTGMTITSAYQMELQVGLEMARQALRGFPLDMLKSMETWEELNQKIAQTEEHFRPHMPPRIKLKSIKLPEIMGWQGKADALGTWMRPEDASELQRNMSSWMSKYLEPTSSDSITHVSYAATQWNPTNKGGNYSKTAQKYVPEARGNYNDYPYGKAPIAGPFTPLVYEEIPLGNRDSVKQVLYDQGWRGINYNDTEQEFLDEHGEIPYPWSGKIDEDSIEKWKERQTIPEWAEGIARWYILCSRRNQILNPKDIAYFEKNQEWPSQGGNRKCRGLIARAWSEEYRCEAEVFFEKFRRWPGADDGVWAIPAIAIPIGTNTFRMRHRNVVNIPTRGLYPLRGLFTHRPGYKNLGCDGSGLELRMLAHFMNDLVYTEVVLHGDIHSYNQEMAGLSLRDTAKTFIYAFLYGSGIPNLAAVCGLSLAEMSKVVDQFKASLPALARLITAIEAAGRKFGHMLALDGRWGRIRAKNGELLVHTILNVLLQMTGSLSMKWGLCFAADKLREEGVALDPDGHPLFLANVHDEIQMEVPESEVESREYRVRTDEWKEEEKRVHIDDRGRMWSAPTKLGVEGDEVLVERQYHRAGEILARSMTKAGEFLHIRIPLAGEYKVGDSWADTH